MSPKHILLLMLAFLLNACAPAFLIPPTPTPTPTFTPTPTSTFTPTVTSEPTPSATPTVAVTETPSFVLPEINTTPVDFQKTEGECVPPISIEDLTQRIVPALHLDPAYRWRAIGQRCWFIYPLLKPPATTFGQKKQIGYFVAQGGNRIILVDFKNLVQISSGGPGIDLTP